MSKAKRSIALSRRVRRWLVEYWRSFSFVGLVFATLFFAASVTPSLLPRHYVTQGLLSGFSIAAGYALGVLLVWIYRFFELPHAPQKLQRIAKVATVIVVALCFVGGIRQMTFWQNSIRELMEMPSLQTADPYRTSAIAIVFAAVLVALTRMFIDSSVFAANQLNRFLPRRIAVTLGTILVTVIVWVVANGVVIRGLVNFADGVFLKADALIEEDIDHPSDAMACGSEESLVDWDSIGRQGKAFLVQGPSADEIGEFLDRDVPQPIRVYVGMRSAETPQQRAELALQELIRVGGFDRSVLVVATPTGTGWLDPSAVDTLEFIHGGDCAIVSTQYSYLPSWTTILVDPKRSIVSADALFDVIYRYWTDLPADDRPRLYLQGLSLGALGSEVCADMYTIFEDPIQGAVWSGPPFPSQRWNEIVRDRQPDSPAWLPVYRDSRLVRFTAAKNALNPSRPWGAMRNVYIQHASDPMIWFSPNLAWHRPDWLTEPRGPDVSPFLRWFPVVTFLQVAFDMPMATSVPIGYGHNYAPSAYIDAWTSVTEPAQWNDDLSRQLKEKFKAKGTPKP
ncbi:alpha/beta hydrolase [Crateriforma conspicua]|uniref:Alpha/beta-hydrolase family protein n=1 Tax=Crateriforma conspicua TaxID=2527996 RepID=A0A5C5Y873_9PLAN|nr:alpha/beta-hydrolase family protein [Crateriforma conspicua]TWT71867.1 hypothetical protein Pan14r_41840 [Crateriforma conspicua]